MTPRSQRRPAFAVAARSAASAGFTLMELIVVLGLLSVLLGIGLGFLQRGSTDLDVAILAVRDQMRLAATTARDRGLPTEVQLLPGAEGAPSALQVLGLHPVGHWHFEPDERFVDDRLRPNLAGELVAGRFGAARRVDVAARVPLLSVAAYGDLFYLDAGVAVRLDLWLDGVGAQTVATLGRTFALTLDAANVPHGKVTLGGGGGRPGAVVDVQANTPLPRYRWVTLELVYDGSVLALRVDDREVATARARGTLFQDSPAEFSISAPAAPVLGVVDEVRLLAYDRGDVVELPSDVVWQGVPGPVRFGGRGELLEPRPAAFALLWADRIERYAISDGGIVR